MAAVLDEPVREGHECVMADIHCALTCSMDLHAHQESEAILSAGMINTLETQACLSTRMHLSIHMQLSHRA